MPRTRVVPTDRECPRCGDHLVVRQIGDIGDGPAEPAWWADDERFCRRGCHVSAVHLHDRR